MRAAEQITIPTRVQAGINGLMLAAQGGHLHIVEFFVGQGVDVNKVAKVKHVAATVMPRSNITDYSTVENRSSLGCSVAANVCCKAKCTGAPARFG